MVDPEFGFLMDHVVFQLRPLQVAWLAWFACVVGLWPRDRWIVGVTLMGLGIRGYLAQPTSPLPDGKGWWLMNLATGNYGRARWDQDVYGDAWESAGSLVALGLGGSPESGVWLAWAMSSIAVAWVMVVAGQLGLPRWASVLAGVLFAVMPLPVALSQSVTRFVLAPTLVMTALAGWFSMAQEPRERRWAWLLLGALSAGLLAHTRPFLIFLAAWLLAALMWRALREMDGLGRWVGGAIGFGLIGWRVVSLAVMTSTEGPAHGAKTSLVGLWWGNPSGWLDGVVVANPDATPILWTLLAVLGLLAPSLPGRWVLAGAWFWSMAPWFHFGYGFDLERMQMTAYPFVPLLAVVAWAKVVGGLHPRVGARGARVVSLVVGVGVVISLIQARQPRGSPIWSWIPEEALLREGLPSCEPSLPVVIGPVEAINPLGEWLALRGWTPRRWDGEEVAEGACRFVGVDAWRHATPRLEGWTPTLVREIPVSSDGWYPNDGERITIGWYRRGGEVR